METVLDCSKNGDTTYHPCVYQVKMFGKTDSVFNLFNNAKITKRGTIAKKGEDVAYLRVNNRAIKKELAPEYFFAIWYQAISADKKLCKDLLKYDDFKDGKSEECMNSQAKVFRVFKKEGKPGVKKACENFIESLKTAAIDFYSINMICSTTSAKCVKEERDKDAVKKECVESLHENLITNADSIGERLGAIYYDYYMKNTNQNYVTQMKSELQQEYEALIKG